MTPPKPTAAPPRAKGPLLALALLAGACASSGSLPPERPPTPPPGIALLGDPIRVPTDELDREIAILEDLRDPGDGRLADLLANAESPSIRRRAALALGRMPYPEYEEEVTTPLCEALADADPGVRAAAAFALGCRADRAAAGVLLSYWRDPDPTVRARIVDAAARVDTPPIRTQILRRLQDPEPEVRRSAAIATGLWDPGASDADDIDSALLRALSPYPDATGRRVEPDRELVWTALYALSRRRAEKGRGAFLEHIDAADPRARIFAARGLARTASDASTVEALLAALSDEDWRVVTEAATGLAAVRTEEVAARLLLLLDHPSVHVRVRTLEALSNFGALASQILPDVWRCAQDLSSNVRAAALLSISRLSGGAEGARILDQAAGDRDPVVRAGAARAAAETLESFRAIPLLERLAADPLPFVATEALGGLRRHPTPRARAILLDALSAPDNGLRLAAVLALAEGGNARAADVPALVRVVQTSTGDVAGEVAFNALRVLGELGGEEARAAVVGALDDETPYVRRVAREVLARDFGSPVDRLAEPRLARSREEAPLPLPGVDYAAPTRNPVAEVVTSRGSLLFELFAAEAPLHVRNFVQLALAGEYDGLTFHRVVPDFVIQGADYRGDGNGARSARGVPLGHEFTPRRYVRGSLGMPRNEDFDSGGSQFFVTHRPTPHLDGRYTLFGELREGFEVLDAIEVGDTIIEVRVSGA